MKVTPEERKRIAQIRESIYRFQLSGWEVDGWESVFFLQILERNGYKGARMRRKRKVNHHIEF